MPRTHIPVERRTSEGSRRYSTITAAVRSLAGTSGEITFAESRALRLRLRTGAEVVDSTGARWQALANTVEAAIALAVEWSELTFGVEIEYVGRSITSVREELARFDGLRNWRVIRDGSVYNGGEVVSPVLRGEVGLQEVERMLNTLDAFGCTVDRTCGMHVHIGVRQFTANQVANVCRAFFHNEHHFDSIVAPSRRGNNATYCRSNRSYTVGRSYRSISALARDFNGGNNTSHYGAFRYRKLNLQSYARHGTIEFRQHQGTVNADKATAWIRLLCGFVAATLNTTNNTAVSFEEFAAYAGCESNFIASRREHFARRNIRRAA